MESNAQEIHYAQLRETYNTLIEYGNTHPDDCKKSLQRLRQLILLEGLPPETEEEIENRLGPNSKCSLRGSIWKILLNVKHIDSEKYINLLKREYSDKVTYQKIRNDVHRTFMNDEDFARSVSQDMLSRCLNAFASSCKDSTGRSKEVRYVQGMNALCGVFLYVLPEVDAFFTFSTLISENFIQYVLPNIDGVHSALNLLDLILLNVDPKLHQHLHDHRFSTSILTPPLLSLATCTPPLEEVLRLWDFYFAFGIHMNVVCTVAQLVLMRDELLAHSSPGSLLRNLPPIHAESIITMAIQLVRQLPAKIYDLLTVHPTSPVQIPN